MNKPMMICIKYVAAGIISVAILTLIINNLGQSVSLALNVSLSVGTMSSIMMQCSKESYEQGKKIKDSNRYSQ